MPRRQFHRVRDERAVVRVGVAKRLELPADAAIGQRHAAGNSDAVVHEELFDALQQVVRGQPPVALHLDIDLVHLQLPTDGVPVIGEFLRIVEALDDADRNVNGDGEVCVLPRLGRGVHDMLHNQAFHHSV